MKILHHLWAYAVLLSLSIVIAQPTIEAARQEITTAKTKGCLKVASVSLNGKPKASTGIYIVLPCSPPVRFRLVNANSEVDADANFALGNNAVVCGFSWMPTGEIPPKITALGHILQAPEWGQDDHWWYIVRTDGFRSQRKVLWIPYLGEKNLFMQFEMPAPRGAGTTIERWRNFRDDILVDAKRKPLFSLKPTVDESSQADSSSYELSRQWREQNSGLETLRAEYLDGIPKGRPLTVAEREKLNRLQQQFECQDEDPNAMDSEKYQKQYQDLAACIHKRSGA